MTARPLPFRLAALTGAPGLGAALLLAATALFFLPLNHLPSFDTPKLAVLTVGAAMLTFASRRRRDGPEPLLDPLLAIPLLVALAAAATAAVASPRGSLVGPALVIAAAAAARALPAGGAGIPSHLRACAVVACAAGGYAVLQKAGFDPAPWGARREVVSTLGNTSFAAELQAALLAPCAVLLLRPDATRGDRTLGLLGAVTACAHLALARSRIDLVAAAAVVPVLMWCVAADRRRARLALAASAVLFAAAAVLFVLAARCSVSWLGRSDTLAVRLGVWSGAWDAFVADPLRMGGAPFVDLFPPHRTADEFRTSLGRTVDTPHMDLLEIAVTCGIAGALAALAWVAAFVRRVGSIRATSPWDVAALAGSAAAIAVSGLASSPLTHPSTALLLALSAGHLVALSPQPFIRRERPGGDSVVPTAVLALLAVSFWPGPVFTSLRSESFVALARAKRAEGDVKRSIALLDAACAVDSRSHTARHELGTLFSESGNAAAALAPLRSAVKVRPGDPDTASALALALRDERDLDGAEAALRPHLAATPWHPRLLGARAAVRLDRGDAVSASADLDLAATMLPHDPRFQALRAEVGLMASPDEARRESALAALAALRSAGDLPAHDRFARAFVRRDPPFLSVLASRAKRMRPDDPDGAVALVLAPVTADLPREAWYFDAAAALVRDCGDADTAAALTGRALLLRGEAKLAEGDAEGARRDAVRATERDPTSPRGYVLETLALLRLGQSEAAKESFAGALAAGEFEAAPVRDALRAAGLDGDPAWIALLGRLKEGPASRPELSPERGGRR